MISKGLLYSFMGIINIQCNLVYPKVSGNPQTLLINGGWGEGRDWPAGFEKAVLQGSRTLSPWRNPARQPFGKSISQLPPLTGCILQPCLCCKDCTLTSCSDVVEWSQESTLTILFLVLTKAHHISLSALCIVPIPQCSQIAPSLYEFRRCSSFVPPTHIPSWSAQAVIHEANTLAIR